jgi:ribose-phosphate pyrophosphokinase
MIVSGSASQDLAAALASELGVALARVDFERFPDGEQIVSVPPVDGRAVVVASTVDDASHVQLLLLQDAVREAGADHVVTVVPYMGYARQDKAFDAGQPVSARAVARAIGTGTDEVVTVNPHEPSVLDHFGVDAAAAVDAAPRLAAPLPDDLADPVFLGPDAKAERLAQSVRDAYGAGDVDHFEKTRLSGDAVEIAPRDVDVAGRDVVVVDDIVATGSTMSEAIDCLDAPASVRVACVHPLLASNARLKLATAGVTEILGTDTIERAVSRVSAAPVVADVLD